VRVLLCIPFLVACGASGPSPLPEPEPQDRALPGPCSVSYATGETCTFTFEGDLLVETTCGTEPPVRRTYTDGVLTTIRWSRDGDPINSTTTWNVPDAEEVMSETHDEYGALQNTTWTHAPADFVLIDFPFVGVGPRADDSLVSERVGATGPKGGSSYSLSYAYEPAERPIDGTRTRIPEDPGEDETVFTYVAGRLVAATGYVSFELRWDGDRLVGYNALTFDYDELGNVIAVRDGDSVVRVFDYSCWN
jgi:YD repeat-containing protein